MFDHVLVALDGSEHSDKALQAGIELASGCGARITLFHSRLSGPVPNELGELASNPPAVGSSHSLGSFYEAASLHPETLDEIGDRILERARQKVESEGISGVETARGTGDAAADIVRQASEAGVDTVVVGARGHARLAEILLGSVAHKVSHAFGGNTLIVK